MIFILQHRNVLKKKIVKIKFGFNFSYKLLLYWMSQKRTFGLLGSLRDGNKPEWSESVVWFSAFILWKRGRLAESPGPAARGTENQPGRNQLFVIQAAALICRSEESAEPAARGAEKSTRP